MNAAHESAFAHAVLDPALPPPPGLVAPAGHDPGRRFDVYRNNVVAGLIDALVDGFPALLTLLGEECFRGVARAFVPRHPPNEPILSRYGDALPRFLETFEPLTRWPWLGDVARLELALRHAHDAADETCTAAEQLGKIDPDHIGHLVPRLHPSARVVRSHWPLLGLWRSGIDRTAPDLHAAAAEDVLAVRPGSTVHAHRLPTGGASFLERCDGHATLLETAAAARNAEPDSDLATLLPFAMRTGAIAALQNASLIPGDRMP